MPEQATIAAAVDVAIVGGGVAGLRLATLLREQEASFVLLEGRDDFGGRVRTIRSGQGYFDLGPAWVWPHQSRVRVLLRELSIETFEQYSLGDLRFEGADGSVRQLDMATMAGSLRLEGGLARLVAGLVERLDASALWRSAAVASIAAAGRHLRIGLTDGRLVEAQRVALALPPRVAAARIAFEPALPASFMDRLRTVPTWMAGHAKAVAIYDRAFWRERGLSGDAMSHRGPLVEIHDASPRDGTTGALFGFFGVPARLRRQHRDSLAAAVAQQLGTIFGPGAPGPRDVLIADWASEPLVATDADLDPPAGHPPYAPMPALAAPWSDRLLWCGSEVASREGGYIEGAIVAAEAAAERLSVVQGL